MFAESPSESLDFVDCSRGLPRVPSWQGLFASVVGYVWIRRDPGGPHALVVAYWEYDTH